MDENPVDLVSPDNFEGVYDVMFVGASSTVRIDIWATIRNFNGGVMYLIGQDKKIYNWSTVIYIQKVEE